MLFCVRSRTSWTTLEELFKQSEHLKHEFMSDARSYSQVVGCAARSYFAIEVILESGGFVAKPENLLDEMTEAILHINSPR